MKAQIQRDRKQYLRKCHNRTQRVDDKMHRKGTFLWVAMRMRAFHTNTNKMLTFIANLSCPVKHLILYPILPHAHQQSLNDDGADMLLVVMVVVRRDCGGRHTV